MRVKPKVGDKVKMIAMIWSDRWILVGETAVVIKEEPSPAFPDVSLYRCKMDKDDKVATCTPPDIEVMNCE